MTETLAAKTASLCEKARAETLAKRVAAGDEMRALIQRNNHPRKGDEERMIECMGVLGISSKQLPEVVQLLEEMAGHESLIAQEADARQMAKESGQGLQEVNSWREAEIQRIEQEAATRREPLTNQSGQAASTLHQIGEARRLLSICRPRWKSLVEQCTFDEARDALSPPKGVPFGGEGAARVTRFDPPS